MLQSFLTQPLGFLLALAAAMALLIGGYVALTGSSVGSRLTGLWRPRTLWAFSIVLIAAWGFKIMSFKGVFG